MSYYVLKYLIFRILNTKNKSISLWTIICLAFKNFTAKILYYYIKYTQINNKKTPKRLFFD